MIRPVPFGIQRENSDPGPFTHIWFWKSRLPERKGQPCRVIARGRMNSILVEFGDGMKVVASRYAVRKIDLEE